MSPLITRSLSQMYYSAADGGIFRFQTHNSLCVFTQIFLCPQFYIWVVFCQFLKFSSFFNFPFLSCVPSVILTDSSLLTRNIQMIQMIQSCFGSHLSFAIMQVIQIWIQIKFSLCFCLSLSLCLSPFSSCCEREEEPMGPIGPWRPAPAPPLLTQPH